MDIVVADGGIAGLDARRALYALAGEPVTLTLLAPDPEFMNHPSAG